MLQGVGGMPGSCQVSTLVGQAYAAPPPSMHKRVGGSWCGQIWRSQQPSNLQAAGGVSWHLVVLWQQASKQTMAAAAAAAAEDHPASGMAAAPSTCTTRRGARWQLHLDSAAAQVLAPQPAQQWLPPRQQPPGQVEDSCSGHALTRLHLVRCSLQQPQQPPWDQQQGQQHCLVPWQHQGGQEQYKAATTGPGPASMRCHACRP